MPVFRFVSHSKKDKYSLFVDGIYRGIVYKPFSKAEQTMAVNQRRLAAGEKRDTTKAIEIVKRVQNDRNSTFSLEVSNDLAALYTLLDAMDARTGRRDPSVRKHKVVSKKKATKKALKRGGSRRRVPTRR